MGLFGRKKAKEDDAAQATAAAEPVQEDLVKRASLGPWDESESAPELPRVNLGAMEIPGIEGMEMRLEVNEETQQIIAVNVTLADSHVQLQAFAAPRKEGIWDEIREGLMEQVKRSGGTADDLPGVFGREILARIPARTASGRTGNQVVRLCGVDGPRWLIRAVFTGPAAHDHDAAKELEAVVRGVIVHRGEEAMAPQDLLPLQVPETPNAAEEATEPRSDSMAPPERGPEIQQIG